MRVNKHLREQNFSGNEFVGAFHSEIIGKFAEVESL